MWIIILFDVHHNFHYTSSQPLIKLIYPITCLLCVSPCWPPFSGKCWSANVPANFSCGGVGKQKATALRKKSRAMSSPKMADRRLRHPTWPTGYEVIQNGRPDVTSSKMAAGYDVGGPKIIFGTWLSPPPTPVLPYSYPFTLYRLMQWKQTQN